MPSSPLTQSPTLRDQAQTSLQDQDAATAFTPGGDLDKVLLGLLAKNEEMVLDRLNERVLRLAFLQNGQNQVRTAKALGVSRNVLRTYLKRYGMIS